MRQICAVFLIKSKLSIFSLLARRRRTRASETYRRHLWDYTKRYIFGFTEIQSHFVREHKMIAHTQKINLAIVSSFNFLVD